MISTEPSSNSGGVATSGSCWSYCSWDNVACFADKFNVGGGRTEPNGRSSTLEWGGAWTAAAPSEYWRGEAAAMGSLDLVKGLTVGDERVLGEATKCCSDMASFAGKGEGVADEDEEDPSRG